MNVTAVYQAVLQYRANTIQLGARSPDAFHTPSTAKLARDLAFLCLLIVTGGNGTVPFERLYRTAWSHKQPWLGPMPTCSSIAAPGISYLYTRTHSMESLPCDLTVTSTRPVLHGGHYMINLTEHNTLPLDTQSGASSYLYSTRGEVQVIQCFLKPLDKLIAPLYRSTFAITYLYVPISLYNNLPLLENIYTVVH